MDDGRHTSFRRNGVLAALPGDELDGVDDVAEMVSLPVREQIYEAGGAIEHVLFPVDAVISLLTIMDDDRAIEVGTVGREGFVGLPVFSRGGFTSEHMSYCQIAGEAVRLSVADFERVLSDAPVLRTMLHRYTLALLGQIAQTSACNRLHPLEQRCARWLLMTRDRVGRDEFPLTQEFLVQILGIRRAGVNEAQQALATSGLISYTRGVVTIVDRLGLQARSCECYALIAAEHERLASVDPTSVGS